MSLSSILDKPKNVQLMSSAMDDKACTGEVISFTHINRTQAGEYRYEASNECGNATKTATIDVQCKNMQKLSFVTCCFLYLFVKVYRFPSL